MFSRKKLLRIVGRGSRRATADVPASTIDNHYVFESAAQPQEWLEALEVPRIVDIGVSTVLPETSQPDPRGIFISLRNQTTLKETDSLNLLLEKSPETKDVTENYLARHDTDRSALLSLPSGARGIGNKLFELNIIPSKDIILVHGFHGPRGSRTQPCLSLDQQTENRHDVFRLCRTARFTRVMLFAEEVITYFETSNNVHSVDAADIFLGPLAGDQHGMATVEEVIMLIGCRRPWEPRNADLADMVTIEQIEGSWFVISEHSEQVYDELLVSKGDAAIAGTIDGVWEAWKETHKGQELPDVSFALYSPKS